MVIVSLSNQAKKLKRAFSGTFQWCYIGKDVTKRQKIADILGKDKRFYFKDRLYKIALEKKQSYLDFVARLGSEQKDQLNWWASKFASKSPFHTDFFLLVCYEALIMELIKERRNANSEKLIIFIEDPWLFVEVRNLTHADYIKFRGSPELFLNKFLCLVKGFIHRLFLVGWFVIARLLTRYYHNGKSPAALETKKNAICIINPADKTVFKDGKYVATYMPGLANFYEENGIPCFYLYAFPFPFSTMRYIRRNQKILWPLINDAKFWSVIKRMLERWKPVFNINTPNTINGCHISYLLEREKWITFSKVGFNFHLILFDSLNNFFSKKWCSHLIYLFENQPWEKMLCLSAIKNGVKTFGYQHSSICKFYISQFIGKGEEAFVPLPYKIVTAGDYFAKMYKEGGMPEDKIVVGGAWRYGHLLSDVTDNPYDKKEVGDKGVVLVSLPIEGFILRSMVENLLKVVSQNRLNGKVELWLRPHPGTLPSDLKILNKLSSLYRVIYQRPFVELLNDADIVIASTSTSGLESFLYGKKVIAYLPENIIIPDPLLDISDEKIYKWYEGESFNMDFLKSSSSASNSLDSEEIKKRYFSKINHERWLNFVTV